MNTSTLSTKSHKLTENRETFIDFVTLLMSTEKTFDMGFIQFTSEAALMDLDLRFRKSDDVNLNYSTGLDIHENYCDCTNDYFFEKINRMDINRDIIKNLVNELTTIY